MGRVAGVRTDPRARRPRWGAAQRGARLRALTPRQPGTGTILRHRRGRPGRRSRRRRPRRRHRAASPSRRELRVFRRPRSCARSGRSGAGDRGAGRDRRRAGGAAIRPSTGAPVAARPALFRRRSRLHHLGRRDGGGKARPRASGHPGGRHGESSCRSRGSGGRRSLARAPRHRRSAAIIAPFLRARTAGELSGTGLEVRAIGTSRRRRSLAARPARTHRRRRAGSGPSPARSDAGGRGGTPVRALVTGASGFIGGAVARALLRRGTHVRVLLRPGTAPNVPEPGEVEIARGDLRDAGAVCAAVRGCGAVFHVGALYSFAAPASEVLAVNVGGTRNVIEAVRAEGARLVYTSSIATVGAMRNGVLPDERSMPDGPAPGPYKESKREAEALVREEAQRGLDAVIVNPTFPVGVGDVKPTPTGAVIRDFLDGRLPAYVDSGMNVIDVDDVAEGELLALERGERGERYILGHANLTMREFLEELAVISGRKPPRIRMPHLVALDLAIERAQGWFEREQYAEGYWWAELESNATMDAEYLLLTHFLGARDEEHWRGVAQDIRNYQRDDGSWAMYHGAPGDLSTSIECYFALKLAGDSPEAPHLARARQFIRARGGIARARTFTRIWLALFGQWSWDDLPVMPPELMLLPASAPFSIYRFSSWARGTLVPLLLLMNDRPVRPVPDSARLDELRVPGAAPRAPRDAIDRLFRAIDTALRGYGRLPFHPFRQRARKAVEQWILAHQEADGSWGGIQPPWVYSLMALSALGHPLDHPALRKGLGGMHGRRMPRAP